MKTLTELLEQWAQMEPDFITFDCEISQYTLANGEPLISPRELQDFIQQAIEARGFRAVIRIGSVFSKYRAELTFNHSGNEGMVHCDSNDSPAYALLSAYLEATQATEEVEE